MRNQAIVKFNGRSQKIIMRKFRAFVITKKRLRLIVCTAVFAAAMAALAAAALKPPAAAPAFSVSDEMIAGTVLDEGVPIEDKPFSLNKLMSKILGFDKDKPETIIQSSSAVFGGSENNKEDTVPETETADNHSETMARSLPTHEQIAVSNGIKINNSTNYSVNLDALCAQPLDIQLTREDAEVLIMHTHTTECYNGDEMSGESERTTNEMYNMCAIGDIISTTLAEYGIKSIHDKTIHDYPTYQGSYTRALSTITKNIESCPTIKAVLDIHRDAYVYNDGSKLRVAANINGTDAAQVMLVLGTDSMGLNHPNWQKNLTFAAKIQNAAEIMYPGLMRPINLRRERFNMHATEGSVLIEIGSNGNTLREAKVSAEYIARAIAAALLNG